MLNGPLNILPADFTLCLNQSRAEAPTTPGPISGSILPRDEVHFKPDHIPEPNISAGLPSMSLNVRFRVRVTAISEAIARY